MGEPTEVFEDHDVDDEPAAGLGGMIGGVVGGSLVGGLLLALAIIGIGELGTTSSSTAGQRSAVVEAVGTTCTHLASPTRGGPEPFASESWTCRTSQGDQLVINQYAGEGAQRDSLSQIATRFERPVDEAPVVCGDGFSITGGIESSAVNVSAALREAGINTRLCSDWS